jgi:hypothetical protein
MNAFKQYKIEIAMLLYWLVHAANCVRVSREPGYYPPKALELAQAVAMRQPYPWQQIIFAWIVLAIVNAGIYWVLRKSKHAATHVAIISIALAIAEVVVRPSDTGGVDYAVTAYAACTFVIAVCWGLFFS